MQSTHLQQRGLCGGCSCVFIELWDWHRGVCCFLKDLNTDMPDRLWNEVMTRNDEDMPSMFNEATTPVKACEDLAYHVSHNEAGNKEPEDRRETSSQVKRRRMLQFNTEAIGSPNCSEDMSSVFLKSNERLSFDEEMSQWVSGFSDASASNHDVLDQSSDGWLAECLNDTEMTFSPDDANFSGETDVQIDISEFCPPEHEANNVQRRVSRLPNNVIFRGKRSYIRPPTKLASSIAYPFAFIKPCGIHGDVTLKDINQRIRTPPPSKSKQSDDDLTAAYPTSAFSGKPVVGKTKIRTEGGKGSITIMRTKG